MHVGPLASLRFRAKVYTLLDTHVRISYVNVNVKMKHFCSFLSIDFHLTVRAFFPWIAGCRSGFHSMRVVEGAPVVTSPPRDGHNFPSLYLIISLHSRLRSLSSFLLPRCCHSWLMRYFSPYRQFSLQRHAPRDVSWLWKKGRDGRILCVHMEQYPSPLQLYAVFDWTLYLPPGALSLRLPFLFRYFR